MKLTEFSGDRRHDSILSDLGDCVEIGLSSEGHRCVGRQTNITVLLAGKSDSLKSFCEIYAKQQRLKEAQLCGLVACHQFLPCAKVHVMFTCDGFLIALPQVDQVPQTRVELLHHILREKAET